MVIEKVMTDKQNTCSPRKPKYATLMASEPELYKGLMHTLEAAGYFCRVEKISLEEIHTQDGPYDPSLWLSANTYEGRRAICIVVDDIKKRSEEEKYNKYYAANKR